ncbi:MAG: hypothetical protein KDA84_09505 [Planctomycetaceae bacterium]|nr:hypothetical protein [Planctomycetaceae bacterium]
MARIDLRDATIYLKDGLSGTAAINDSGPPMEDDTTLTIDTIVLNTDDTDLVPIGARFTVSGETDTTQVHTVTARTPTDSGPTTDITFTPALGPGTYADDGVITFQSQRLEIKIGQGNLTYTESDEYNYELDRDQLDTVTRGADQPMQVSMNFVYEAITTGTGETIAPMDAIKRRGAASEWVSSATDLCEPYAVDVEVVHTPNCGTKESETTIFPDFRSESREVDFQGSSIAVSGRCNTVEPIVSRA